VRARRRATRVSGEISDKDWREGLFAVCALIDEMILCSAWPGRDKRQLNQLQHHFFNTTNAGTEFFDRLKALTPDEDGVREVYGWCLAMGFKGAYFRPEDAGTLEGITRANLDLAGRRLFEEGIPHLFPDAYGVEEKRRKKGMGRPLPSWCSRALCPSSSSWRFLASTVIFSRYPCRLLPLAGGDAGPSLPAGAFDMIRRYSR
jgi:type VI secretion system protein ImpK